ncbi:MAG: glutamate--cysteine ligase [Candidatus Omnitrophota bacterium]
MNKVTLANSFSQTICVPCIEKQQQQINQWLLEYEKDFTPIYSSVDIRDAGFKIAVVDTNLFPAGFNNLCEHGIEDAIKFIKTAIYKRIPLAKNILIVAEEHTRNTWYLENIRILQELIQKAGFQATIATFFDKEPTFCEQAAHAMELETATGKIVKINCFRRILEKIENKQIPFDLIIMNNDLTGGIPDALLQAGIPTFPSIHAGWHSRSKSAHFRHTNELMQEFANMVGLDPWLFSCLYREVQHIDINSEADRQKLYIEAKDLFEKIQSRYDRHHIEDKPFIFIKADSGTYGLGVVPIERPEQILELNRRKRNDLSRDKAARDVTNFLLQEGVPTIHRIEKNPSEVCIYQIDNNLIGGFYRSHTGKNSRENLNSPGGMEFQKMCPHLDKYGKDCGITHDLNIFDIYRILARIAGVAATREINDLEHKKI